MVADLSGACPPVEFLLKLSLHCHKTTGLVKCFENRHTLLNAEHHLAQCMLFTWLQTPVFLHPVVPPFTFLTIQSILMQFSNCCMFF